MTTEAAVVIDTKLTSPIKSIHAKFGDRVKAGAVIATLDPTFSAADLAALAAQKKSLDATLARLQAERKGEEFSIAGHEGDSDWAVQYRLFTERTNQYAAEMLKFNSNKKHV